MLATVANKLAQGLYLSQDAKFVWINERFADIFGYQTDEIYSMNPLELIHLDDQDYVREVAFKLQLGELGQLSFEIKGIKKDGSVIDILVINSIIQFEGKPTAIGSVIDITNRKKMEMELKESKHRYQTLVENSPLGILVHQKGMIEYANPMALRLFGTETLNDIVHQPIDSRIHQEYKAIAAKRIHSIDNQGKYVPSSYEKFVRFDGSEIDVEVKRMPIQLNGEAAVQVVFWDVSEKKKEEELIRYRAFHDTLTDLPNRHRFQLDLAEEIDKDATFTIMYLDLNGLKPINDSHGHQAGDLALVKAAARLAGVIGSRGLVYRLGGDEFAVVLLGHKNEDEVRDIANSIAEILNKPIYLANTIVHVTPSIGVVFYPEHGVDMELLVRHADIAMYHAKKTKTLYKIYDR